MGHNSSLVVGTAARAFLASSADKLLVFAREREQELGEQERGKQRRGEQEAGEQGTEEREVCA